MTEKVPGVNLEVRMKCAKGTKMSKRTKTIGALIGFANHDERKHYMKLVAKTQHEADTTAKNAKRGGGGGYSGGQPTGTVPGAARTLRPGEASTAE